MTWFVFSGSRLLGKVVAASKAAALAVAEATFNSALPPTYAVVPVSA